MEVLKGVDLTVRRGETVAILGASGSGSRRSFTPVGALDAFDAGEVTVDSTPVSGMSERSAGAFGTPPSASSTSFIIFCLSFRGRQRRDAL